MQFWTIGLSFNRLLETVKNRVGVFQIGFGQRAFARN
jgi:hypothetical protein